MIFPFKKATDEPGPQARPFFACHLSAAIDVGRECCPDYDPDVLLRCYRSGSGGVVGSWAGRKLVGFCLSQPTKTSLSVRQLAVLPDYRRRGRGRAMLAGLEGGAGAVTARVPEDALGAQLFLKACGYRYVGKQEVGGGRPDHYVFVKHLGEHR